MSWFVDAFKGFIDMISGFITAVWYFIGDTWNFVIYLLDFVKNLPTLIYQSLVWLIDTLIFIAKAIPWVVLKSLFTVILVFINSLDFTTLALNTVSGWGLLPPQLVWLISAVGLSTGISMIGSAFLLRFLLNLIPGAVTRV